MTKSLVTGGAGFIGSHLVERLISDGHDVVVLDNFVNGKKNDLAHLSKNSKFVLKEVDVVNFDLILPYFKDVEHVYHLAAMADIVPSIENPSIYHRANVDGSISVLEAARANGVKKFIYAASSSCYGIPNEFPTKETSKISPQYPYALTKRLGEELAIHFANIYNLNATSLRLFNVYGPRARTSGNYGAVFGVFLAQKIAKKPFTIVGDGKQTRDFTFVSDVIDAMVKVAEKKNLRGNVNFRLCKTLKNALDSIFKDIKNVTNKKVTILLSPASASYDQFKNFEERGNYFKNLVTKKFK